MAFSPDGRHLASAGFDFTVRVWDATTGKEVQALKGHDWPIHGVAFSPDGRHLASCSADSTVRVWDWTTGQELRVLEPRHAARVESVAFSRDGKLLASASWDRTVKVWDTATWKLLHDLHDPTGARPSAWRSAATAGGWPGAVPTAPSRSGTGPARRPTSCAATRAGSRPWPSAPTASGSPRPAWTGR